MEKHKPIIYGLLASSCVGVGALLLRRQLAGDDTFTQYFAGQWGQKSGNGAQTPTTPGDPSHALNQKQRKMAELDQLLQDDIFTIGIIRPQELSDLLSFEDFDRVYRIIQKHANLRLSIILEEETVKRLQLLSQFANQAGGYNESYRQLAINAFSKEEQVYSELASQIFQALGIEERLFMESQFEHLRYEENQEQFYITFDKITQMQQKLQSEKNELDKLMNLNGQKNAELTKEQTIEIFKAHQKLEQEALAKVARLRDDLIREEYLVQNAYIADQMLLRYGITSQELNRAMAAHDLLEDAEVIAELQKSKLPDELQNKVMEIVRQPAAQSSFMQGGFGDGNPQERNLNLNFFQGYSQNSFSYQQ